MRADGIRRARHASQSLEKKIERKKLQRRPVGAYFLKHIAICAGGLGFNSRPGKSDTVSPMARHPCDVFLGAVLPRRCAVEMSSATRYSNTAYIMKI